jgi:hypothetical protein
VAIHETDAKINWSGMGSERREEAEIKYAFSGDEMTG